MKIAEFLKNDFKVDRWKTASSKNAYALMGKKDFMQSAAFFLLGGHYQEAIYVVLEQMQDLQLALLLAKLLQRDDLLHQIYQDKFLSQTDQWA